MAVPRSNFRQPEAEEFLESAHRIIEWAEGRI
jgi:HEPN domain-containing protein